MTLRNCITTRGPCPDLFFVPEDRSCGCLHVATSRGPGPSCGREAKEGRQPLCPSQPGGHGLPPAGGIMARVSLLPPATHFQGLYKQWGQVGGHSTLGPLLCLGGDGITPPWDLGSVRLRWGRALWDGARWLACGQVEQFALRATQAGPAAIVFLIHSLRRPLRSPWQQAKGRVPASGSPTPTPILPGGPTTYTVTALTCCNSRRTPSRSAPRAGGCEGR